MKAMLTTGLFAFLLVSCTSEKLDREIALQLLKDQKEYPKMIEEEIYTADPVEAKRILESGLEKEGLFTVLRTQNLTDIGKPLISFTSKAKPYLLPQTYEDLKNKIQRVKIAEEVINEVTGIQMLEGDKQAIVEYKNSFKNISPFSKLSRLKLDGGELRKANFLLYDDGWRVEKK